jgi:hypothetical protein
MNAKGDNGDNGDNGDEIMFMNNFTSNKNIDTIDFSSLDIPITSITSNLYMNRIEPKKRRAKKKPVPDYIKKTDKYKLKRLKNNETARRNRNIKKYTLYIQSFNDKIITSNLIETNNKLKKEKYMLKNEIEKLTKLIIQKNTTSKNVEEFENVLGADCHHNQPQQVCNLLPVRY